MRLLSRSGFAVASALLLGAGGAVLLASSPALAQDGYRDRDDRDRDPLTDTVNSGRGTIDYGNGTVKATGRGAMPSRNRDFSSGQARLMARGAARADALRNLAMAVSSVQVTSTTKVKNYVMDSDTVETRVSALLQSPRVISERDLPDGTAEVVVELPLYGRGSVAEAILPEVIRGEPRGRDEEREPRRREEYRRSDRRNDRSDRYEPAERPARGDRYEREEEERTPDMIVSGEPVHPSRVELKPSPGDTFREPREPATRVALEPRVRPVIRPNVEPGLTPSDARGPFSAVIVDCRGLNLRATLAPKLFDVSGRELYGTVRVDPDFAIETGIVGYPRSMYDALRSKRAGNRPLIVKAVRAGKGGTDAILSYEDADRVLDANKRDQFFEKTRVIFLCDPVR